MHHVQTETERDSIASILCKCERDNTTHVLVHVYRGGIALMFGDFDSINGFQQRIPTECIFFVEAPELEGIFTGGRWQWDTLYCLIDQVTDSRRDTPAIPALERGGYVWHIFR